MQRNGAIIDCANPVNWTHPQNVALRAWFLCVPGLSGGAKWHNLCSLPNGISQGNHGVLTSMAPIPTATSGWAGPYGRVGGLGSVSFDGTDDVVVAPSSSIYNPTAGLMVAFWMRTVTANRFVIDRANSALSQGWNFNITSTGRASFFVNSAALTDSGAVVNTGIWTHVICSWLPSTLMEIYVDSFLRVQKTSSVPASITDPGVPLWIGERRAVSDFYLGQLDDLRIHGIHCGGEAHARAIFNQSRAGHPDTLRRVAMGAGKPAAAATGNRRRRLLCGRTA